jgi:hypothetical protein
MLFGRKTLEALGTSEDRALSISEDVRHRDEERLAIQAVEGLLGGLEKLHTDRSRRNRWSSPSANPNALTNRTGRSSRCQIRPERLRRATAV